MRYPRQSRTLAISGDALPVWGGRPVLEPVRLSGTEKLGALYEYVLESATTEDETLRVWQAQELVLPEKLVGREMRVSVEYEGKGTFRPGLPGNTGLGNVGAGRREIVGLLSEVRSMGADDRHAYYTFVVRPWLWLATLNRENRIFQGMSVVEITQSILNGKRYPFPYELRLGAIGFKAGYPKRDYVRQHWESDFQFLSRLWREWGIYFFMDRSTLVLCDSPGSHKRHGPAYETLAYHAPEGKRIDEEHIHKLSLSRELTAGIVTLTDYDATRSRAALGVSVGDASSIAFDNAERYGWGDYSQPKAGFMGLSETPNDYQREGEYLARVRLDAERCRSLRARGKGNLLGLVTGCTFHLEHHPVKQANAEYLVISTTIDIRNVDETSQSDNIAQYQCETAFVLQPANTFFKNRLKKKPRCADETAIVVGPQNQPMWVDRYARVKVQFLWDRLGKSDQNSSVWLRVSSPWQGDRFGTIYLPRIGQEVTVSYHEGDPDKPYVSDRMVNELNQPPWALPDNHALSGTRTQEINGGMSNSVVADDTTGKLQVQVASDYAQSRLVLGYNTRIAGNAGRKEARGEGVELATDAWAVVRAGRGMLLSTEARPGATAQVKDMGETVQRLTQARDQHETLANAAVQAQAHDPQDKTDIADALKTQNDDIRGEGTGNGNSFPGLAKPHLVLASPAGIEATTAGSTHLASGEHTALTSSGHISMSSGSNLLMSARNAVRIFAYRLGIRIASYAGDIDITALKKNINLLARLEITQSADSIVIKATKQIVLNGGDSYIRLENGKVTVGAMRYLVNAQMSNLPPKPMGVNPAGLPDVQANDQIFRVLSPVGLPLARVAYRMQASSGAHVASTRVEGHAPAVNTEQPDNVKFDLHLDEFAAASGRPFIPASSQT
ncbi:type VI secretion system Vgr family protein [Paraburkholderia flava]|uniref:type VI secretion system Vgr family protein n=1 Tax=Paraburkholderia flava TaxID=2547393 RepID=UPI00141500BE|nr:type VI secretion system Vgr family protein [Paraburkholderia flava]